MSDEPFSSGLPAESTSPSPFAEDVPITTSVAEAIGHAVVEWGRAEDTAGVLIADLLGADSTDFRAVSTNLSGRPKIDSLETIAKLKLPEDVATPIVAVAKAMRDLQGERNSMVHGCWYPIERPDAAMRHAFRARGTFKHARDEKSADDIKAHAAAVAGLTRALNVILEGRGIYRRVPRA